MRQRGRGNDAEGVTPEAPEPPTRLTDERATIWRDIVESLPADWFTTETLPLLEAYVNRIYSIRVVEKAIADELAKPAEARSLALLGDSAQFVRAEISAMQRLATALRLSQHSRRDAKRSSAAPAKMPWKGSQKA